MSEGSRVQMGMTRLSRGSQLSVLARLSSTTMTTLAQLVPLIYHERQEEGSMLCAQHALNNLLRTPPIIPISLSQSPTNHRSTQRNIWFVPLSFDIEGTAWITALGQFSTTDLSAIARGLDELEQSVDEDRRGRSSQNMDDTGTYLATRLDPLCSNFTRFLFTTGLTKISRSLQPLVGAVSKYPASAADGSSIWRLRNQTRKLAKPRDERVYQPSPVCFTSRSSQRLTNEYFA